MLKTAIFAALALVALAAPAMAQDNPAPECYQSGPYFVVTRERTDEVGSDIIVKTLINGATVPTCAFVSDASDLLLNDPGDAFWYAGMSGKYLVLTRSTGPEGDLVIYDMSTGKKAIDVPVDDSTTVAPDAVTYWIRGADGTADNCSDFADNTANGLGSIIADETVFDVATGAAKATGQQHCSATQ